MQEIKIGDAWVSNTHAENTGQESQRLLVDWVTCSFYFASKVADLAALIGLGKLEFKTEKGARYSGYDRTHISDSIEILESDSGKFMLNFRGQACRLYEEYSTIEWRSLFALLIDYFNAKFTRLDIACDDFESIFQVSTIRQAVYKKLCVTRLKDWGNSQRGLIEYGDDILTMDSFYLGDAKSRYHLNVYDKKMEREGKGKEVTVSSWTRTELRLKNEYATNFASIIAKGEKSIGYYFTSFLNEKIQFLKPDTYSNKSRAAQNKDNISRWWIKFLGKTGKLNLSMKAPDRTLDDVKTWVLEKVSPSLAMIYEHDPKSFLDHLNGLVLNGRTKFTQKHYTILNNAKIKKDSTHPKKIDELSL